MKLTGLHLLLTYQCTFECDHCFVWGSPWQEGTMTLATVREVLRQARDAGTVESIYFEGGEPFLYYPIMVRGVREAADAGFSVGIVSNAYWATDEQDALEWLRALEGLIGDLSVSSDLYHYSEKMSRQARLASEAAGKLKIPVGVLSIAQPGTDLSGDEGEVMYRGRAAETLVPQSGLQPWEQFGECPYEDLREPGRVHVDYLGNLHICQGICIGNVFEQELAAICASYDADEHPVVGPLLAGGPAELVRRYDLPLREDYADACYLCYRAREQLRPRFPSILGPDQVYGIMGD
jgi:hypothetical protein